VGGDEVIDEMIEHLKVRLRRSWNFLLSGGIVSLAKHFLKLKIKIRFSNHLMPRVNKMIRIDSCRKL